MIVALCAYTALHMKNFARQSHLLKVLLKEQI